MEAWQVSELQQIEDYAVPKQGKPFVQMDINVLQREALASAVLFVVAGFGCFPKACIASLLRQTIG